ncbi:MAG: DUF4230 domain-containing protein [Cyclobacteriaceae bacterium]
MQNFFKNLIRRLPWILLLVSVMWFFILRDTTEEQPTEITSSTILTEIESLGKLELIRYNFQEVTEIKNANKIFSVLEYIFPENRAVLISRGEAVGCIDLLKLAEEDIAVEGDTVYIRLPPPELCYFKVDLENSRVYDIQTAGMSADQRSRFTETLFKTAEAQIKSSALRSGILENTETNAKLMLETLFEKLTQKKIIFTQKPEDLPEFSPSF